MIVRWILAATLLILLAEPFGAHAQTYACVGDCNLDGVVTVDELVLIAEIALGNVSLDLCPAASANGDPTVTIDEVLASLLNALDEGHPPESGLVDNCRRGSVRLP